MYRGEWMLRLTFFRLLTILVLLAMLKPLTSESWLRQESSVDNILYPFFKKKESKEKDIKEQETNTRSPITILTVDSDTIKELGWPLSNQIWNQIFRRIKKSNYEIILNLLRFSQKDRDTLAKSLASSNIIGSSLKLEKGSPSLNGLEEDEVGKKALLYSPGLEGKELPIMPLSMEENLEIIINYKKNGILPFFSESQRNSGFEIYREFSVGQKQFAIPFSSFWAIEHLLGRSLETSNGARSKSYSVSVKKANIHFFANPYKATSDYLKEEKIEKYALLDILRETQDLPRNRLLILSADGLDQSYPGPSNKLLPPHKQDSRGDLIARTISEVYQDTAVASISGSTTEHQKQYVLVVAALLIIGLIAGKEWWAMGISISMFILTLVTNTNTNHEIEISSIFNLNYVALALIYLIGILFLESMRSATLRRLKLELGTRMSQCKSAVECEKVSVDTFAKYMHYFPFDFKLSHYQKPQPSRAYREIIAKLEMAAFRIFTRFDTATHLKVSDLIQELLAQSIEQIKRRDSETESLIKIKQMNAKSEILGKFLSDSLVSRFSASDDLEQSLTNIIRPRRQFAAILQADVRGFSNLTANMSPEELVAVLQRYYIDVVNFSQTFSQVKLIGDAVFLFAIDTQDLSACRKVFQAAQILIESTRRENSSVDEASRIHFGIAMNYGEVVAGNLSSNTCIDYTVIGLEVNKTARLEELTKDRFVSSHIGKYSCLMTHNFYEHLPSNIQSQVKWLALHANQVKVRSFPEIRDIGYYTLPET